MARGSHNPNSKHEMRGSPKTSRFVQTLFAFLLAWLVTSAYGSAAFEARGANPTQQFKFAHRRDRSKWRPPYLICPGFLSPFQLKLQAGGNNILVTPVPQATCFFKPLPSLALGTPLFPIAVLDRLFLRFQSLICPKHQIPPLLLLQLQHHVWARTRRQRH